MEQVICKGRTSTGIILVEVQGEKTEILSMRGVRCGLSWPSPNAPGFYVLVGQEIKKTVTGTYLLRLLREGSEQIPSALFGKMASDMGTFFCEEIFTDTSEKFKGYIASFDAFRKERRRQKLYLQASSFDFSHGIFTIRGWIKNNALTIPKASLIFEQLKSITSEDLKREPGERFFGINALRFAIGSFEISDCAPRCKGGIQSAPPVECYT